MKLEIGVCKAKPRIKEINPSDTTAAHQFTNNTDTVMNTIATPTARRRMRCKLKRETVLRSRLIT
jgi:hypothetical protein